VSPTYRTFTWRVAESGGKSGESEPPWGKSGGKPPRSARQSYEFGSARSRVGVAPHGPTSPLLLDGMPSPDAIGETNGGGAEEVRSAWCR
jgi:hypothetical protein